MLSMFEWSVLMPTLGKLAIAYALSLPIAWEREHQERSAGLRTFPLVALACCGYMLLSRQLFGASDEAQARVAEGLITGIGFIGGGAILKTRASVQGTATAASIWNTGAIGMAVAYSHYEIALALSVVNFLTLRLLTPLKPRARDDDAVEP